MNTYQWITARKLRSEDGRSIEIIERRPNPIVGHRRRWFIRETTQFSIRDHHFPEIRTFRQIASEAQRIAEHPSCISAPEIIEEAK